MIPDSDALTQEIYDKLEQGSKVEFKWHGSKMLYIGRIELDKSGTKYFVNEHCYENDKIKECDEGLRFYNSLASFFCFTHFRVLS